jgi:hypothetical protein
LGARLYVVVPCSKMVMACRFWLDIANIVIKDTIADPAEIAL